MCHLTQSVVHYFVKRCGGQFKRGFTTCFFFPGQGSQSVGMCKHMLREPTALRLFEKAREILGYDLLRLCLEGPVEDLNKTQNCQPAVVVASLAALQNFYAKNIKGLPDWLNELDACTTVTAGFSVGEISALIFSGALSFEDGLKVVQVRARAMQEASDQYPSGMVSVIGHKEVNVMELCDAAMDFSSSNRTQKPVASIANYLFPGGWVIGGDASSVEYILEFGKAKHCIKRAQLIPVSGAFHTDLMKPAQAPLREVLESVCIQTPKCTVYSGTSCTPFTSPGVIKSLLVHQLVEPVNWLKTIKNIFKEQHGATAIYEVGPGKQLRTMISRIDRTLLNNFTNLET